MTNEMILFVGLGVLALIFLMGILARMYRKAGPNEALIVYGFRGPRVIKGHGTVIFPMVENCRELSLELMSFDVAPQQDLYTKQGVAVTVEAVAQIKVRSDQASILTAAEQFLTEDSATARGIDSAGDGRPSARHHRPVDGGADCERAGDGGRAHARDLRGRHEQDGARGDFVHDQGSARQERIHLQHGPAGCGAHQARCGDGNGRCGARYGDQAGDGTERVRGGEGTGGPGARDCGDCVGNAAG